MGPGQEKSLLLIENYRLRAVAGENATGGPLARGKIAGFLSWNRELTGAWEGAIIARQQDDSPPEYKHVIQGETVDPQELIHVVAQARKEKRL